VESHSISSVDILKKRELSGNRTRLFVTGNRKEAYDMYLFFSSFGGIVKKVNLLLVAKK